MNKVGTNRLFKSENYVFEDVLFEHRVTNVPYLAVPEILAGFFSFS